MTGGAQYYGLRKVTAFSPHGRPWKMSFPLRCRTTRPTWVSRRAAGDREVGDCLPGGGHGLLPPNSCSFSLISCFSP